MPAAVLFSGEFRTADIASSSVGLQGSRWVLFPRPEILQIRDKPLTTPEIHSRTVCAQTVANKFCGGYVGNRRSRA